MSNKNKVDRHASMHMRVLHQNAGTSIKELKAMYPQYSQRTIYRHARATGTSEKIDKRKQNKGRPSKLTIRDNRKIVRTLHRLRAETANFTAKRIQEEAGLSNTVSHRTLLRALKKNGYRYLQSRKKGLLTANDKKKRVLFARSNIRKGCDFWCKDIVFYLDGVGFAHKYNPYSEARAASTMQWRKRNEGLARTTKGRKEGSGGNIANFMVAVAHDKGVVFCKHYPWTLTGAKFAELIKHCFPLVFEKCGTTPAGRLFLQDGDPRQTSKAAQKAWVELGCEMFAIPPRSPDLNPIENVFHLIREQLRTDALEKQIRRESYDEFCKRVATTINSFPVHTINKTIESMDRRLEMIIRHRGDRTKY